MNNGNICVPVAAETSENAIADARLAAEFADVVEIRADALEPGEIANALTTIRSEKPLLITYRPSGQGGYREISVDKRVKFWNGIGDLVDTSGLWFDREGDLGGLVERGHNAVSISSFHDFDGVPADLDVIYERLTADGDVAKIAVTAADITDAIPVWKLLERAKSENKQIIPIAMGEAGKWTRILGLAHGAFLTYASLDARSETASGQITAKDMTETYRVRELDESYRVFGLIGHPVAQSLSPYMHNPAFVAAEINAVFIHLLVKNIDEFMRRMVLPNQREVELNFCGFAVTMPHKQAIMKYLDTIDATAEKIGAVNTVKIDDGKLIGYNTDAHGFLKPLKANFGDMSNSRVAVFGAGGAARACVYVLKQEGADVTVFARDLQKAEMFAAEFDVGYESISTIEDQRSKIGFDILVDATPLGMKGPHENDSLFTAEQLVGVKFVFDLVTKSVDTPIIHEAKKAGVACLGGLEMLIAQGARQFEIWTGREAPVEVMRNSIIPRMEA